MAYEETLRQISLTGARFGMFVGHALLLGLPLVLLLVVRPAVQAVGEGPSWQRAREVMADRVEGFVQAALVASAMAAVVFVVIQATLVAEAGDGDVTTDSITSVLEASYGRWYLLRIPLLIGLVVLLWGRIRDSAVIAPAEGARRVGPGWWGLWILLATALSATATLSGHTSVARPLGLAVVNDVVHMVTASTWFAGIVVFASLLPSAWGRHSEADRLALLTPNVHRFSKLAMVCIAIVAVTGVVNSLLHVEKLTDLVETGYGQLLALKLLLFGLILALGALNHFVVRRRLERAASDGAASPRRLFRRAIAVELIVGLAIFTVTSVLTGSARTKKIELETPPATSEARDAR